MYVLHAHWNPEYLEALHLWGETSEKPAAIKNPKGRKSKTLKPLLHPFSVEDEKLKELVTEISGSLIGESIRFDRLNLRLPSMNSSPIASPQLIHDQVDSPATPKELQQWHVPSAILNPGLALAKAIGD